MTSMPCANWCDAHPEVLRRLPAIGIQAGERPWRVPQTWACVASSCGSRNWVSGASTRQSPGRNCAHGSTHYACSAGSVRGLRRMSSAEPWNSSRALTSHSWWKSAPTFATTRAS